jgi:hypothetical protein
MSKTAFLPSKPVVIDFLHAVESIEHFQSLYNSLSLENSSVDESLIQKAGHEMHVIAGDGFS